MEHKKDSTLILETGEYSDRSWHGPFRALRDFSTRDAADRAKAEFRPKWEGHAMDPEEFIDWLIKEKYIELIDCNSEHVGSYGHIEIDS